MTADIDALSGTPLGIAATRESPSRLSWLLIGLVFVVAIMLRQVVPLNTDVSWLLIVGERMLDGQRLYADIVEINPPMAAFAYLPGIAFSRVLGVDPRPVMDTIILMLAAASLASTRQILKRGSMFHDVGWGPLAIWAAAVLTIMPMQIFGQREHIATIVFLPAIAVYALRCNRELPPLWAILIAGIGASITLMFKPFFAAAVTLCIVTTALRSSSWRTLFAPENLIAGGLLSIYSVCAYKFYPEYFTVIYPLVRDTYLSWSMPASVVLINSAMILWLCSIISIFFLRRERGLDAVLLVTLVASLGFAIAFILQRRGWAYHSYPMVAFGMLAVGYAVASDAVTTSSAPRRFNLAAMFLLAASFASGCVWFDATVRIGPLEEAVASLGRPRPKILMLSGEAAIGHPLVRTLHGIWVSRQENLWVREFVRLTLENGPIDPLMGAKLQGYLALERTWLIEDFKKQPPDVVLIDTLRDDWGAWARSDSELTKLLEPYARIKTIDGVDILRRDS
jgi:hypothetical protein